MWQEKWERRQAALCDRYSPATVIGDNYRLYLMTAIAFNSTRTNSSQQRCCDNYGLSSHVSSAAVVDCLAPICSPSYSPSSDCKIPILTSTGLQICSGNWDTPKNRRIRSAGGHPDRGPLTAVVGNRRDRGGPCSARSRGVPPRHFPESPVAASMSVSAADRACTRGEVSLSDVASAAAPSKSTASWLPSR
jgi:hypothetical protein